MEFTNRRVAFSHRVTASRMVVDQSTIRRTAPAARRTWAASMFHLLSVDKLGAFGPAHRIVQDGGVTTHFQPIFSARQRAVIGVEALSRGVATDGSLIAPDRLFGMAAAEGLLVAVEDLCRQSAIRNFACLDDRPEELLLFLNLDLVDEPDPESLPADLDRLLAASGISPTNVAVEFLEARLDDVPRFGALAARLRERGFLVVLDDVGAGHSNLDRIPMFRPDIIKIDRGLLSSVDTDYYKQGTLRSLVGLARQIGALVVAEGIETEGEAITALELGADLLQGYFLGRPQPASAFANGGLERAAARIATLACELKSRTVTAISQRRAESRRFGQILGRILGEVITVDASAFDDSLAHTIKEEPSIECAYVLDDSGVQITETIWNGTLEPQTGAALFRPAPKGTDHSFKEYYYVPLDPELQRYTTDSYVSLASGNLCRTVSVCFRDPRTDRVFVLCVDIRP